MDETKQEESVIPKKARKWGVGRVLAWCIGGVGALVLLPVMTLLIFTLVGLCGSVLHLYEFDFQPPRWTAGLALLTPENSSVETLASEYLRPASRGEEFILRLGSDDDCARFVEQILRRNPNARVEPTSAPPVEGKLYANFAEEHGCGGARYVFDLYGGCPYGKPEVDSMYVESGANRTWYVLYLSSK